MSEENKPQESQTPEAPKPAAPKPAAPGAPRPGAPGAPGAPRPAAAPGAPGAPGAPRPAAAPGAPGAPGAPRPAAAPGAPGAPGAPRPAAAPGAPGAPAAAKPAAATAAPAAAAKKEEEAPVAAASSVSRREFLNYVWGASIALFTLQFGGLTFFFAFPRFRPGQFGGKIPANVSDLPELNKPPIANDVGKFWLVNTDQGVNVLYKICTHLGCIYPWSDAAGIFACPCHGSQFQLNGDYIAGPAPRALDKFKFEILDASGNVLVTSPENGAAVALPSGAQTILVDTGTKIEGKSNF